MNKKIFLLFFAGLCVIALCSCAGCVGTPDAGDGTINITDAFGRVVTVPDNPDKIAVSGSGSMRYFIYLDAVDRVVAVDYTDTYTSNTEGRPYMLARPDIQNISAVGGAKSVVDVEKLLTSGAEVIFMGGASSSSVEIANEIQEKSGIPVVMFYVGNYVTKGEEIRDTFRMIGEILHKEERAEELITYFDSVEADLKSRVADVPDEDKQTVYIAGISYQGAHGATGTDPTYYPFTVLDAKNVVTGVDETAQTGYAEIAKEQLLEWDPDIIFVDLGTLSAANGGVLYELANDPSYQELTAVKTGQIYTVNPHTWANVNHETTLVNAYYIGKVLYPEQFADINLTVKANEIYSFVDGAPVYEQMNENREGLSYQKIEL